MGMFSFKCKGCGTPINSAYTHGEHCTMYLLKDGEVLEEMTGVYDGYGRIKDRDWETRWEEICALMFNKNEGDGIAVVHTHCRHTICNRAAPTTQSEQDPDQGFGRVRGKYCVPSFKGTASGVWDEMGAWS